MPTTREAPISACVYPVKEVEDPTKGVKSKKSALIKELIRDFLKSTGWALDRSGNAQKVITHKGGVLREYRVVFQPRTVRLEGKLASGVWVKVDGCIYGGVEVRPKSVKIGGTTIRPGKCDV